MQRINFRREPQENDMGKSPAAPTAKGADRNARLAAELRANLMKRKAQSRKRDRFRVARGHVNALERPEATS